MLGAIRHQTTGRLWPWVVAAAATLAYARQLPATVQSLDTGELVLDAWGRFVPHPPGYPTYLWLYAGAIAAVPRGTVFWRAALLSAVLGGLTLGFVATLTRHNAQRFWLFVLPLAAQPTFWRYARLPDVFMLNAAISTGIIALTAQRAPSLRQRTFVAALFGLGLGNHQTLLFLMPLVVWHSCRGLRAEGRQAWLCPLGAAVITCGASYLSLLALHTDDIASWGQLRTLTDLWHHMLRRDYGTFQLSPSGAVGLVPHHAAMGVWHLVSTMPVATFAAAILPYRLWATRHTPDSMRLLILWGCAMAYITIFLAATNTTHAQTLARFYLLPLVWCACLAATSPHQETTMGGPRRLRDMWARFLVMALALAGTATHIVTYHNALNFAEDYVVEDYARNILHSVPEQQASLLVLHGDTRLHAVRYAQRILGIRPDVLLLSRTAETPGLRQKLTALDPDLVLPDAPPQTDEAAYVHKLFARNTPRYAFVVSDARGLAGHGLHERFLGLGRQLSLGEGYDVHWPSVEAVRRRGAPLPQADSAAFQEERDLFAGYAYPYLALALTAPTKQVAQGALRDALAIVPYCLPAYYELCLRQIGTTQDACQIGVRKLEAKWGNYY